MSALEWRRGGLTVTTDPAKQDLDVIHSFLCNADWAKGIPRETVRASLANSLCFAVLDRERQVGFARVISDFATIAYLGDVFVLDSHRGRGLAKWMLECINAHPQLQNLRRWVLVTSDAHGLYARFGFTPLAKPSLFMEKHNADVYL